MQIGEFRVSEKVMEAFDAVIKDVAGALYSRKEEIISVWAVRRAWDLLEAVECCYADATRRLVEADAKSVRIGRVLFVEDASSQLAVRLAKEDWDESMLIDGKKDVLKLMLRLAIDTYYKYRLLQEVENGKK